MVPRIWGIWGSDYKIPKAIFYLLKGDYKFCVQDSPSSEVGASAEDAKGPWSIPKHKWGFPKTRGTCKGIIGGHIGVI